MFGLVKRMGIVKVKVTKMERQPYLDHWHRSMALVVPMLLGPGTPPLPSSDMGTDDTSILVSHGGSRYWSLNLGSICASPGNNPSATAS